MLSKRFHTIITHKWIILASFVIILYLLPYYVLGEDAHIRIHDNLDSNIVWYKILAESGHIFTLHDITFPQLINGLPRSALPSPFDAMVWLYVLFKPMTAYAIGQTIMRFVAFSGMYALLQTHILRHHKIPFILAGAALAFALLPFWPSGMLSIAGIPLALTIFLTIRDKKTATPVHHWIMLGLIPFFSSFVLTFVFFLALIGMLWLVDWLHTKHVNWPFFMAITGMTLIYLLKNGLLLYAMFVENGFTSHREELNLGHKTFTGTLKLFQHNFINGHTHDLAVHFLIVLPVIGLSLLVAAYYRLRVKWFMTLFLFNVGLSFWYALWYWDGLRFIKDHFAIANTFNFSRVHFLHPVVWYILFAMALTILWKHIKSFQPFLIIIIILQCSLLFNMNEESKYSHYHMPTFKEFYATDLFTDIKHYIGKKTENYRVVSIGLYPAITQYNGFYTLDTYNNTYPLAYKHAFRKVIAPELDKSPSLKHYYDTWGGRVYLYSSEIGKQYMIKKGSNKVIKHLSIRTDALRNLGGTYIFSAVPIENADEINLHFRKKFQNKNAPWQVYLYQLNGT